MAQDLENVLPSDTPVYDPKAPLNPDEQGWIEQTKFRQLRAIKFFGGLPVFTSIPTYAGSDGEMVFVKTGTSPAETYDLYSYIPDNATSPSFNWRQIGATVLIKTGTDTKAIPAGLPDTATQTIAHGLGKTPTIARFYVALTTNGYFSNGNATASQQNAVSFANGAGNSTSSYAIYFKNGANPDVNTGSVSFDATNITINWSFTWGTGTYLLLWEVQ